MILAKNEILKMWISHKMRFWKCEFSKKWEFERWIFGQTGFLPQCESIYTIFKVIRKNEKGRWKKTRRWKKLPSHFWQWSSFQMSQQSYDSYAVKLRIFLPFIIVGKRRGSSGKVKNVKLGNVKSSLIQQKHLLELPINANMTLIIWILQFSNFEFETCFWYFNFRVNLGQSFEF